MGDPVLSVDHLRIVFGGTPDFIAVKDLSFRLMPGRTLAVVGESGSGKSLTALALMNLLPKGAAMEGNIRFHGRPSGRGNILRGKDAGMIFQEPMSALNPVMKVGKQLGESIRQYRSCNPGAAKALAVDWLRKVQLPDPEGMYHRFPHQLSGGQKQRVLIAMAMCNHPAVLIADEPTTALDVTVQQEIIALMRQLQAEYGTAMIFITHDLALAASIADEVLVMYRGNIMEYGTADAVLSKPAHPYTRALLLCRPSAHPPGERLPMVQDFWNPEKTLIPPASLEPHTEPAGYDAGHPGMPEVPGMLLEVKDLSVWFKTGAGWRGGANRYYKAVEGVSFSVFRGEVLGLAGESGCGKSTLSRCLMGLVPATSGSIRFAGSELTEADASAWMRIRRKMQMVFQDPFSSLNPRLTVGAAIEEPLRIHRIVPASSLRREALRLLDLVQLPAEAFYKYPHQFSGGQKQRIGIARALALRPELLICDESVSALDVSIQAQMLNLLKDLRQEFDLTYLFISHDLSVIRYLCDRVMIMKAGRLVEAGTSEQVFRYPGHEYTRTLLAAMPPFL